MTRFAHSKAAVARFPVARGAPFAKGMALAPLLLAGSLVSAPFGPWTPTPEAHLCSESLRVAGAAWQDAGTPQGHLLSLREQVAAATVVLPERSCAGVIVGARSRVVTAAHCISARATRVLVELGEGRRVQSEIAYIDRANDLAVLRLAEDALATPLEVATDLPIKGDPVLFVGRVDRRSRVQVARIERLGACPSLPGVPQALFTTVRARPGDSGAPLVDASSRVVGLIHGGARCHIAAPTAPLSALPSGILDGNLDEDGTIEEGAAARVLERKRFGPIVLERTLEGLRFHLGFSWQWRTRGHGPERGTQAEPKDAP